MVKKTITYRGFDDSERTKDFYFSMNQTEFGLLNNRIPGGLENYLKTIQENNDSAKLLDLLVLFITESYGERSADGESFFKKDSEGRKLGEVFLQSNACDKMIAELLNEPNEKGILTFLVGILPADIRSNVQESVKKAYEEEEKKQKAEPIVIAEAEAVVK